MPAPVVVGATGWIGRALVARLRGDGVEPTAVGRPEPPESVAIGRGAVVFHLAGLAHRDARTIADDAHDRANHRSPLALAGHAARSGAARLVFVSTAAVMGARSVAPWRETDPPAPADAYARAKRRAEEGLLAMHARGELEVSIVRPPLVYGPGVRANFLRLLDAAASGRPLPLAGATAPRSMVYLDNLVDALVHVAGSPAAAGRTFFVADDVDLGVAQWVGRVRDALGLPRRLFALPRPVLAAGAALAGRADAFGRVFEPMQVDASALRATGWRAPVDPDEALRRTLAWHAARRRRRLVTPP